MDRVQKIISQAGITSRRKAEELIEAGKVRVNDIIITLGDKADPKTDKITVDGKPIELRPKTYYMLHKPKGYISTSDDKYGRKKVLDLVPKKERVFTVGRLDRDATGLLILTNDGDFANKIMHPSHEVKKTYIAVLDQPFQAKHTKLLEKGIKIDKQVVKGTIIQLNKNTIAVQVHSGLNKVVKRVCKEMGYYVRSLHRTHIGNLAIDIPQGEFRELTHEDRKQIFAKPKITKETFTGHA